MRTILHTFDCKLTLENAIEIATDTEKNIMSILRTKYEKKSYLGKYILTITKIVKMSKIHMNSIVDRFEGTINVKFMADCIVIKRGQIFPFIKIFNKSGYILGRIHDTALVNVDVKGIQLPDDTDIPIKTIVSYATPGNVYSVYAELLKRQTEDFMVTLGDVEITDEIENLMQDIKMELEKRKTLKKENILFFEHLFFNCSDKTIDGEWYGPDPGKDAVSIFDKLPSSGTSIYIPATMCFSSPYYIKKDMNGPTVGTDGLILMLETMYMWLVTINDMVEHYVNLDSPENKRLWKIIEKLSSANL